MHGYIQMPDIYLYFVHGCLNAFCTRIHKLLEDKVNYASFPAYSIDPNTNALVQPNTHVIPYEEVDLDE